MLITARWNVLLHVIIDWNLSLLPHLLLLKDLLLLLTTVFARTFQVPLISHVNLLLADALVWALFGPSVNQNWRSFVLVISKLGIIASSLRTFVLVLYLG
jgi:hypothetical protein